MILTNYSLKLSKIYLQLVNRYTSFHTTFHIMLGIVMALIMFISCTSSAYVVVPLKKERVYLNKKHRHMRTQHGKFHIRDKRDITHSYRVPIKLNSHTELTVYCKDHKIWETIRATWNGQRLVYTTRRHKRFTPR